MDLERVDKPVRQLRELLKSLPENPPPEEVHQLRTRARRIEAVARALEPTARKETRRLLKAIKPVRKAAGGVRDMDVLTADLLHLKQHAGSESMVRLIEHLGALRSKSAGKLLDTVSRQRKPARRHLKEYSCVIESVAAGKKPVRSEGFFAPESGDGAVSGADGLIAELSRWPALNARNLHDFRLKVKELRYVLQMFREGDKKFVEALGKVKDAIGNWHDWQQLDAIAREVLNSPHDRELLRQIEQTGREKFAQAITAAIALRRRFLRADSGQGLALVRTKAS